MLCFIDNEGWEVRFPTPGEVEWLREQIPEQRAHHPYKTDILAVDTDADPKKAFVLCEGSIYTPPYKSVPVKNIADTGAFLPVFVPACGMEEYRDIENNSAVYFSGVLVGGKQFDDLALPIPDLRDKMAITDTPAAKKKRLTMRKCPFGFVPHICLVTSASFPELLEFIPQGGNTQ